MNPSKKKKNNWQSPVNLATAPNRFFFKSSNQFWGLNKWLNTFFLATQWFSFTAPSPTRILNWTLTRLNPVMLPINPTRLAILPERSRFGEFFIRTRRRPLNLLNNNLMAENWIQITSHFCLIRFDRRVHRGWKNMCSTGARFFFKSRSLGRKNFLKYRRCMWGMIKI